MGKKGITPIIAIILLLMMTVAVAGAAFFWLSRIQNQLQGGVESYQSTMLTQMASKVDVLDADLNGDNLTIFLQNTGNTKIPVTAKTTPPTTTWILKDENQIARCSSNWANSTYTLCTEGCGDNVQMDVGVIHKVVLTLGTKCHIDGGVGGNDTGKVFSFTIDFSGKTTSSGSFVVS
jgi:flagellin-like protein